jgi:hypothetical protein
MEYTFSDDIISDLHKDARGHRPSHGFMLMWNDLTPAQKQETWDNLCHEMEYNQKEEARIEAESLVTFKANLKKVMEDHGVDWRTALRWMADGEEMDIEMHDQEFEHFLWRQGISFEKNREIIGKYWEAA